ncbi:MAG TPA: IS66 family transposase [Chloroflexota bacterium]
MESYVSRDALLGENAALLAVNAALRAENGALREQVATLTERLTVLEQRTPPPGFKANRPQPPRPRAARKRRGLNSARRREEPTATVTHALDACPDCGAALSGGEVVGRRQIIDVPLLPATITEHVTLARRCRACQTTHTPLVDLSAEVLGQQRVSLRLMALIVVLREHQRLPFGQIQRYLQTVHQLHLSCGELVAIVATCAARGTEAADAILAAIRERPVVHADETSWREDGQNGYLWGLSSGALRYFRRGSRRKQMVDDLLGEAFDGVLVTDFYAAYDHYPGPHQRCWVHLLRAMAELGRQHPADAGVARWARAVRRVYDLALADPGPPAELEAGAQAAWRRRQQRRYEDALQRVCGRFVGQPVPQRVLCQRVQKYLPELFTFIADPRVPADNNAAERSVRPIAVRRKISGGTRSAAGSLTRTVLWTLVDTFHAQGKHLLDAWMALLRNPALASV